MALQNDTSRIQYNGNNSTTNSYVIPFVFFENSHIKCVVTTSAGVDTELTLGSGFNVTGAGNQNGGSLTTMAAVPTTSKITIFRNVPATQTTSYQEGGDFPAASHERALDKLTMIAQQTKRLADRALKVPETQNNPNDLPNPGTGQKLLGSNNGTLTWEDNRQLPPYPAAAGTNALVTSGGGASPSWQTIPSIAHGPVTATGSTTPRFIADRFAEAFNVDDYGAKGDWNGSTGTDDRAAIQSAINAAIAAGGGIIRFGANKRYYLASLSALPVSIPEFGTSTILSIYNAPSTTRLFFEGNGATLVAADFPSVNSPILTLYTAFDTVVFQDLQFERLPYLVTPTANRRPGGVFAYPYDADLKPSKLFAFYRCTFIDCYSSLLIGPPNTLKYLKLLQNFVCEECKFLYPRGGSAANYPFNSGAGADVAFYTSKWCHNVDVNRAYFDGCVGNRLPSDVQFAKDGFQYITGVHNRYRDCYFTGNPIETLIAREYDCIQDLKFNYFAGGTFTQPAVGSSVTVTANWNQRGESLFVGKIYMLSGIAHTVGNDTKETIGFYRLTGFAGAYPGVLNGSCTFQRVSEASVKASPRFLPLPTGATINAFSGRGIVPVDVALAEEQTFEVTGCVFDGREPIQDTPKAITAVASTNTFTASAVGAQPFWNGRNIMFTNLVGGSGIKPNELYFIINSTGTTFQVSLTRNGSAASIGSNISSGTATQMLIGPSPAFACQNMNAMFTNNVIVGNGIVSINDNWTWGPTKMVIIANNHWYIASKYKFANRQNPEGACAFMSMDGTIFRNNHIRLQNSSSALYSMFVWGENMVIEGNVFEVLEPFGVGAGASEVPNGCVIFVFQGGASLTNGWRNYIQNNVVRNFHYYARAGDGNTLGPYTGQFLIGHTDPVGGGVIKVKQATWRSPNGTAFDVYITNDGELEVQQ